MSSALQGLTVLTFEQAVAAPYCTSRLAQDGARVIKIERPEGDFARGYDDAVDGEASYFVWLNAGKESIALNLKDPDDLALTRSMLEKADIVVQNFAPGALKRIGIDLEEERKSRPELITLGISGYGTSGPYAEMKAYDLLIQAESGLCAVTGSPDSPARVGVSICDIATGMQAYAAILRALLTRAIKGHGEHLEISMFESMTEWVAVPFLQTRDGGKSPKRMGVAHPSIAPYGVFNTADFRQLLISVQNEREWKLFASDFLPAGTAGDARFENNVSRCKYRAELDALITASFAASELDDLVSRLSRIRIAFARLRTLEEVVDHPALVTAPVLLNGKEVQLPVPGGGRGSDRVLEVPGLNQHGNALRQEFAE